MVPADAGRRQAIANYLLSRDSPGALSAALAATSVQPRAQPTVAARRPAAPRAGGNTLVVGDSIGVGTAPHLKRLGNVTANVVGGRSSANGIQALRSKLAGGKYATIVLDLGTNDGSSRDLVKSVREARRLAPNAKIVVPLVNGPNAASKNASLRRLGGNVRVVDVRGKPGPDGIHYSGQGYRQRANHLIAAMGR